MSRLRRQSISRARTINDKEITGGGEFKPPSHELTDKNQRLGVAVSVLFGNRPVGRATGGTKPADKFSLI
jgi:hypothetical protein